MKIDSHKFAPAPRPAERSQPAPAAAPKNSGIVPTTKRPPSDSFVSGSSRPATATTGNTGVTGAVAGKTKLNMDFDLAPSLEPHRELFAKVGARIAKLPTEELRTKAIDRSTTQLAKFLKQPADQINAGLKSAVAAQLRVGPTATNDPQECAYRVDRLLNYSPNLLSLQSKLKSIGQSLSKDTSLKNSGQVLKAAQSQIDQLGLQGREKKIAQRYLLGLVKEDRTRTGGFSHGGVQLPQVNSGTFHILPYGER